MNSAIVLEGASCCSLGAWGTLPTSRNPGYQRGMEYVHGMHKCEILGPGKVKLSDAINDALVDAECFCEVNQVFAKAGQSINSRLSRESRKIDQETGLRLISRCIQLDFIHLTFSITPVSPPG